MAANGSYGSMPIPAAVSGMNCAMPMAPADENARGSYADSCRSVAAKSSGGSDRLAAAVAVTPAKSRAAACVRRGLVRSIARAIANSGSATFGPSRIGTAPLIALTPAGEGQLNTILRARSRRTGALGRAVVWYMVLTVQPYNDN